MTEEIKQRLVKVVDNCKPHKWPTIANAMNAICETHFTSEQWRGKYRSITGDSHKARAEKRRQAREAKQAEKLKTSDLTNQILSTLKTKRTLEQDADILHISNEQFIKEVEQLKGKGYNIVETNHLIWLETAALVSNSEIVEPYSGESNLIFGVISDTHLCNKCQQLTYLNNFYDRCASRGIKTIYHCGDISDGFYKNRPDHIYELFRVGFDEQSDYIIKNYPYRDGITTKFITGNHDATHMKNGGADIGLKIAEERPDMKYLGYMKAKIWLTPQCDMDLFHPLDGNSYALSYQLQKHIDGLQGGTKPRILCVGHWHKQFQMFYRNIQALSIPCFEAQTRFEEGKHINAVVGGWIVQVSCKPDGTISEINYTFIPYYDMIKDDYKKWRA
jgi:predicted phosphodiesterase